MIIAEPITLSTIVLRSAGFFVLPVEANLSANAAVPVVSDVVCSFPKFVLCLLLLLFAADT